MQEDLVVLVVKKNFSVSYASIVDVIVRILNINFDRIFSRHVVTIILLR